MEHNTQFLETRARRAAHAAATRTGRALPASSPCWWGRSTTSWIRSSSPTPAIWVPTETPPIRLVFPLTVVALAIAVSNYRQSHTITVEQTAVVSLLKKDIRQRDVADY